MRKVFRTESGHEAASPATITGVRPLSGLNHTTHRYRIKLWFTQLFDLFLIAVIRGIIMSSPLLQFIIYTTS